METFVKLCPECRTATALQAVRCHNPECGHIYRTQFDPITGQAILHSRAAITRGWLAASIRRVEARARVIGRATRLLLAYAGPLIIVSTVPALKDRQEAPVLIPFLLLVTVIWLWYLSDAQ
jgi:hypothetical protein